MFRKLCLSVPLFHSTKILRTANNKKMDVLNRCFVDVRFNGQEKSNLELYIVNEKCPTLMGQSWITTFLGRDWLDKTLSSSRVVRSVQLSCRESGTSVQGNSYTDPGDSFRKGQGPIDRGSQSQGPIDRGNCSQRPIDRGKYSEGIDQIEDSKVHSVKLRTVEELKKSKIFEEGLGCIQGAEAKILLKEGAEPRSLGVRPLPYAKKAQVGAELQKMLDQGILSRIEGSPWGTPIVPVFKGTKTRICGSYNLTINQAIAPKQYPLPTIEECFNKISGGIKFSKLDIKQAYNNIMIRPEDRVKTTINTHIGPLQWNRLPYGIAPAGAIFQETIEDTLFGIEMCCVRVDDVLVSGRTEEEHIAVLNEVVSRFEKQGYKCKPEKAEFLKDEIVYLGHLITKDGIKPVKSKVQDLEGERGLENSKKFFNEKK